MSTLVCPMVLPKLLKWSFFAIILAFHVSGSSFAQADTNLVFSLLQVDSNQIVKKVISNPDLYRLQMVYSEVYLDQWNCLKVKNHTFRLKSDEYFYPASLVKLPLALLTLEWLDKNGFSKEYILNTKASSICTGKYTKPDSITIAQTIEKSLVVSDNKAFNELYELLGVDYINSTLHKKGYSSAQIFQRLDNCDYLTNLKNDSVSLVKAYKDTVYRRGKLQSLFPFETKNAVVGTQFFNNGKYLETGKNFKHCNQISLMDLHNMLISSVFPSAIPFEKQFCLNTSDQNFLLKCLQKLPNELDSARYSKRDSTSNMDFKYILAGGSGKNFPTNVKIFNKVGLSYGFMEDIAFVVDTESKTGFFLSCVLFANEDGIMNDGKYEYNSVGFPFMKRIGEIFLDYHLKNRPNTVKIPDFLSDIISK